MKPLADQLRPENLADFVGQKHLVGEGRPLRLALETGYKFSFILWGPPGSGKTSLARIYAKSIDSELYELSAVSAGKDDIRKIVNLKTDQPKVLFLDEIHRFNKAQQDFLLPYVETGELILIGATTENPSFEIIAPLLSRLRVFTLEALDKEDLKKIIQKSNFTLAEEVFNHLINLATGDARRALSILDSCYQLYKTINTETLIKTVQNQTLAYDKSGAEHYNLISAYIKSLRASQPNAALYYLARMIEAGEEPKFIARRMVVFASEDIGQAQPTALVVAGEIFRATGNIGLPEVAINLAHGTVFLAQAKKDRSACEAYFSALADVRKYGALPVPLKIRNAPTQLMKDLDYGRDYEKYSQADFLPDKLKGKKYFKS